LPRHGGNGVPHPPQDTPSKARPTPAGWPKQPTGVY
jgi:hypothetical protein